MKFLCTGVILSGGLSTRYSGQNKALLKIGGKRILDHIYEVFSEFFEDIILVTNNPLEYLEWDFNTVTDLFPIRSSLTGIHAGLFFTRTPYAFISACDTPFLRKELIETLLEAIEPQIDIVIPETSKGIEPLCAVYSKQCLKLVETNLVQGKFKIQQIFSKLRIKKIPENIVQEKDPHLMSFININTPNELARAEAIIETQL